MNPGDKTRKSLSLEEFQKDSMSFGSNKGRLVGWTSKILKNDIDGSLGNEQIERFEYIKKLKNLQGN